MTMSAKTAARIADAARAVAPYGFVVDVAFGPDLRAYEPFALFSTPGTYVVGARGTIEGERVEAYEYAYTSTDAEGHTTHHDDLVVAVHHRAIRGAAAFTPDEPAWSSAAAFVDAILWVPPFTFLKVFQLLEREKHPDHTVGEATFDRLYRVRAASEAAAREAITPGLVRTVLGIAFRGAVEIRPGVLLARVPKGRFDHERLVPALGVGAAMLSAFADRAAHGYRS